jgi:hypothetical protein
LSEAIDKQFERVWTAAQPKGSNTYLAACWRLSKGACLKSFERAAAGKEIVMFADRLVLAIQSQNKHRKLQKASGEFIAQPKGLLVWINQQCWLDEFDVPKSELMSRAKQSFCHCGKEAFRGDLCEFHFTRENNAPHFEALYSHLKSLGLGRVEGEPMAEYSMRCRRYIQEKHGTIAGLVGA